MASTAIAKSNQNAAPEWESGRAPSGGVLHASAGGSFASLRTPTGRTGAMPAGGRRSDRQSGSVRRARAVYWSAISFSPTARAACSAADNVSESKGTERQ